MFLSKLFNKAPVYLEAKIDISQSNSSFSINFQSDEVKNAELILLGLLLYARILRVESSKSERDKLVDMFIELQSNYTFTQGNQEYLNAMLSIFSISANSKHFKDNSIVKLRKADRFYLDMKVINVDPLSSVVYTTFLHIHNRLDENNKVYLIEGFALLSKLYQNEKFSVSSAVDIPNMIVFEILPLN